ncbi:MAG TPA: ATP-binding domain-containing protein [Acidimicrobiales bacterium]|nr:ATP-binding domain-containing protein [Acidimicrobiales bacterium]
MSSHPDLPAEQAHIDRAYERVAALRASATDLLDAVFLQRGGTPQSLAERDVLVRTTMHRLEQLELGSESLCFGRIDRDDGDAFHIGRLAVSSEDQEPLVVDWRAPVAEPFYRATGVHPMGLFRRRHFATEGRRLLGIEDEVFGEGGEELEVAGGGALFSALERSRSGRMRDIVATVQREQDEIIRADMAGVLVVQGGPGTGKTAVALHRAAYLLYTYRFPLERQGVLLIGPNPVFLRYIGQVLPSLGESGVALSTIEGLVPGVRVRRVDANVVARAKGDARMAKVLARAVKDRQRPLKQRVEVGFEGFSLKLGVPEAEAIVASARRRPGTHNVRRRHVEALVARHLHDEYERASERRQRTGLWIDQRPSSRGAEGVGDDDADVAEEPTAPEVAEGGLSQAELWWRLRPLPAVTTALDRMWPLLTPEELLHDLFGAPPLLRLAGRGILSDDEVAALHRPRSATLEEIPWTAEDLPLLDEARVLLGPRSRSRSRRAEEEIRAYGHIVVDEAQDLTLMQLRMLARRSLGGSMTIVGDIAQATGPWAPPSWDKVLEHLPSRKPPRVNQLSIGYRTPASIMTLANKVLAVAAPELTPPTAVREGDEDPQVIAVGREELAARVATIAAAERDLVGEGNVAVIVPDSLTEEVAAALRAADVDFGEAARVGLDAQVNLVPVRLVKGLELDSVIVVEPARIVAEEPQGLRALYVALTRATRRLAVLHAEPLPEPLR